MIRELFCVEQLYSALLSCFLFLTLLEMKYRAAKKNAKSQPPMAPMDKETIKEFCGIVRIRSTVPMAEDMIHKR